MGIRLPKKAKDAAARAMATSPRRPFTAGELKALWLQYPTVVRREYSCLMKRTPATYKKIYEYMTKCNELDGGFSDSYFHDLASLLKTTGVYSLSY
jgi:hypothetical protein